MAEETNRRLCSRCGALTDGSVLQSCPLHFYCEPCKDRLFLGRDVCPLCERLAALPQSIYPSQSGGGVNLGEADYIGLYMRGSLTHHGSGTNGLGESGRSSENVGRTLDLREMCNSCASNQTADFHCLVCSLYLCISCMQRHDLVYPAGQHVVRPLVQQQTAYAPSSSHSDPTSDLMSAFGQFGRPRLAGSMPPLVPLQPPLSVTPTTLLSSPLLPEFLSGRAIRPLKAIQGRYPPNRPESVPPPSQLRTYVENVDNSAASSLSLPLPLQSPLLPDVFDLIRLITLNRQSILRADNPAQSVGGPGSRNCPNHPEAEPAFGCDDCKTRFCWSCVGRHASHPNAVRQFRAGALPETFAHIAARHRNFAQTTDATLERFLSRRSELVQMFQNARQNVNDTHRRLQEALNGWLRTYEDGLKAIERVQRQSIDDHVAKVRNEKATLDAMERVLEKCRPPAEKFGGFPAFETLVLAKEVENRLTVLEQSHYPEIWEDHELRMPPNSPVYEFFRSNISYVDPSNSYVVAGLNIRKAATTETVHERPLLKGRSVDAFFYVCTVNQFGKLLNCDQQKLFVRIFCVTTGTQVETHIGATGEPGKYAVRYSLRVDGEYQAVVKFNGQHIRDSPLTFHFPVPRAIGKFGSDATPGSETPAGSTGKDGELQKPWGICVGRNEDIIVADRSTHSVQVFDESGKFVRKLNSLDFYRPTGVAVDSAGRLIVTDKDNHRIQVFDADGDLEAMFGEKGDKDKQFQYPYGVAVNHLDDIIVADSKNDRVVVYCKDLTFMRKIHVLNPRDVACTRDHVIVGLFDRGELRIFNAHFTHYITVGESYLGRPQGITIDVDENVLVVESTQIRTPASGYVSRSDDAKTSRFAAFRQTPDSTTSFLKSSDDGKSRMSAFRVVPPDAASSSSKPDDRKQPRISAFRPVTLDEMKHAREISFYQSFDGGEVVKAPRTPPTSLLYAFTSDERNKFKALNEPCGICVTRNGKILVVDSQNSRVLIFR